MFSIQKELRMNLFQMYKNDAVLCRSFSLLRCLGASVSILALRVSVLRCCSSRSRSLSPSSLLLFLLLLLLSTLCAVCPAATMCSSLSRFSLSFVVALLSLSCSHSYLRLKRIVQAPASTVILIHIQDAIDMIKHAHQGQWRIFEKKLQQDDRNH